jgi:RNA polymerase sigma-70 factor (family 1)
LIPAGRFQSQVRDERLPSNDSNCIIFEGLTPGLNRMDLTEFEAIYHELFTPLCNTANRIINDRDAAKDIVQELFIKFWNSKPNISTSPAQYLHKSVINSALNYLDSHKRRSHAVLQYKVFAASSSNNADESVMANELSIKINEVFNALPPMCKKVFALSRYEYMSHKEIAGQLGISANTVDNHIKYALNRFRNILT